MKERYSLLEIMKNRGISYQMYRQLSREINDRKQVKQLKKEMDELKKLQDN